MTEKLTRMQTGERYYTDDLTLMPVRMIWRSAKRVTLPLRLPVFLNLLARKSLGLGLPANHGSAYLDRIVPLDAHEIPESAREAFAEVHSACRSFGFGPVICFRAPYIGRKVSFSSVSLHESGIVWSAAIWFRIWRGEFDHAAAVFSCHSKALSGTEWHTAPVEPSNWIPELIPPNHEVLPLPPQSSSADVITEHMRRIEPKTEWLTCFSPESLADEIVRSHRELLDHYVQRGIYRPLTDAEVRRFTRAAQQPELA